MLVLVRAKLLVLLILVVVGSCNVVAMFFVV